MNKAHEAAKAYHKSRKQALPKPSKRRHRQPPFRGTYRDYLDSPQWAKKRRRAFAFYGKACTICGATEHLQVHHRHYKTLFREGMADLDVHCRGCHQNAHEEDKGAIDPMTAEYLALRI